MFDIVEFITNLFKPTGKKDSGQRAKERLKLVLISDRATVSPHVMQSLREELIEVISRYMTVDTGSVEMGLQRKGNAMALAANIPVIEVKRGKCKKSSEVSEEKRRIKTTKKTETSNKKDSEKAAKTVKESKENKVIQKVTVEKKETKPVTKPEASTTVDSNEADNTSDDSSKKRQSRKRVRRYKTRTGGGRRTARKRTKV